MQPMNGLSGQEIVPSKPVAITTGDNSMGQLTYHELEEVPVRSIDSLEQLQRNMIQLSNVRTRLQFMMREIRYVMKV